MFSKNFILTNSLCLGIGCTERLGLEIRSTDAPQLMNDLFLRWKIILKVVHYRVYMKNSTTIEKKKPCY